MSIFDMEAILSFWILCSVIPMTSNLWLKDLVKTGHSKAHKQVVAVLEELLKRFSNDIPTFKTTTIYCKNTVDIISLNYIMKENDTIIHSLTEHVTFIQTFTNMHFLIHSVSILSQITNILKFSITS